MNIIGPVARYTGPPSQRDIRLIQSLTRTDSDGRRYYRTHDRAAWRSLRTAEDFTLLNAAIDCQREAKKGASR